VAVAVLSVLNCKNGVKEETKAKLLEHTAACYSVIASVGRRRDTEKSGAKRKTVTRPRGITIRQPYCGPRAQEFGTVLEADGLYRRGMGKASQALLGSTADG